MARKSAGLLLFRCAASGPEVLLVHPGGPYWSRKDQGAWSIPKGEFEEGEDPLLADRREFHEETGLEAKGEPIPLSPIRQPSGKTVHAWALEQDVEVSLARSNTFAMEWPPKSGETREFPEVDRAEWFSLEEARQKIQKGQSGLLDELAERLSLSGGGRLGR